MSLAEILVVLVLVLVVVGPERLPAVARTIGKGLREIRRATNLFRDTMMVDEELDVEAVDAPASHDPVDGSQSDSRPAEKTRAVPRPHGRNPGAMIQPAELEPSEPAPEARRIALASPQPGEGLRRAYLPLPHREIPRS